MKKAKGLLLVLLLLSFMPVYAQSISPVGLGLRITPDGGGFTGKFFIDRNFAIEAQLNGASYEGSSVTLVGLLEYHIYLNNPAWRVFLGAGFHVGRWGYYYDYGGHSDRIFGLDGILGIEYVLRSAPIGFSFDVKPGMNLSPEVVGFPNNAWAISGRFYFGRRMGGHRVRPVRQGGNNSER